MSSPLKNTNDLKRCKVQLWCVSVSCVEFSVALQNQRKTYNTSSRRLRTVMPNNDSQSDLLLCAPRHFCGTRQYTKTCADAFPFQCSIWSDDTWDTRSGLLEPWCWSALSSAFWVKSRWIWYLLQCSLLPLTFRKKRCLIHPYDPPPLVNMEPSSSRDSQNRCLGSVLLPVSVL